MVSKLTLYTKNLCPYCTQAKTQLKLWGIQFEEINIEEVTEAKDFVINQGHRTMPQIYLNGELFVEGGAQGLARLDEDTVKAKMGNLDLGNVSL